MLNESFFRFDPTENTLMRVAQQVAMHFTLGLEAAPDDATRAQLEQQMQSVIDAQVKQCTEGLAKMERTVQRAIVSSTLRARLSELVKQLIMIGNALPYVEPP